VQQQLFLFLDRDKLLSDTQRFRIVIHNKGRQSRVDVIF
jgi:hypothetical protein